MIFTLNSKWKLEDLGKKSVQTKIFVNSRPSLEQQTAKLCNFSRGLTSSVEHFWLSIWIGRIKILGNKLSKIFILPNEDLRPLEKPDSLAVFCSRLGCDLTKILVWVVFFKIFKLPFRIESQNHWLLIRNGTLKILEKTTQPKFFVKPLPASSRKRPNCAIFPGVWHLHWNNFDSRLDLEG